jgi:DNA-binding NtrC family response regulator
MALSAQVRLLRVLEDRQVTRIGGSQSLPVDVRVIAASNRDLRQAVAQGQFRRDLYHRLKVVELPLPPLRARPEDIPVLIEAFTRELGQGRERHQGFSPAAMDMLLSYDWPGNVRELRNLIEYVVFLGPQRQMEPADLVSHLEGEPRLERHLPVVTHKTPDQSERELIYFALLDLKREVSDLRRLIEDSSASGRITPSPSFHPEPVAVSDDAAVGHGDLNGRLPVEVEADAVRPVEEVRPLKELEREAVARALEQVNGNRREAAQLLGIGVRTLYRKLDEYGLK